MRNLTLDKKVKANADYVLDKKVCSAHFKGSDYTGPDKRFLPETAVPIVTLPNEIPKTTRKRKLPTRHSSLPDDDDSIDNNLDVDNHSFNNNNVSISDTFDEENESCPNCKKFKEDNRKLKAENKSLKEQVRVARMKIQKEKEMKPKINNFNLINKLLSLQKYERVPSWIKEKEVFQFAVRMFLKNRRSYELLREEMPLPSNSTLKRYFAKTMSSEGICPRILSMVKEKKIEKRECLLLIDELSITPGLHYDMKSDKIKGFTSFYTRCDKKKNLAKHGLVFMIKGISEKWRQAIGFYLTRNLTADRLESVLINTIKKIEELADITVKGVIFNQATHQWLLASRLTSSYFMQYFTLDGCSKKRYIFIDPPHLLKSARNALFTYDIEYSGGTAKLSHLKEFIEINTRGGITYVPGLNSSFLNPKMNKMKVQFASKLFSRKVYCAITRLIEKGSMKKECSETANFVLKMNNLFDLFNRTVVNKSNYKSVLEKIDEAIRFVTSWQFCPKRKTRGRFPDCKQGFLFTLRNLADYILNNEMDNVCLRAFSQDALENFFSEVRSRGGFNPSLNCHQLSVNLRNLSLIKAISVENGNCEDALCENLLNEVNFEGGAEVSNSVNDIDIIVEPLYKKSGQINNLDKEINMIEELNKSLKDAMDSNTEDTLQYMAGFFCMKLVKCSDCKSKLTTDPYDGYIKLREYDSKHRLYYPSTLTTNFAKYLEEIFIDFLGEEGNLYGNIIQKLLANVKDMFGLTCHPYLFREFAKYFFKVRIFYHVSVINQALSIKNAPKTKKFM